MTKHRLDLERVACSDLGDEIVLLDLPTSGYFSARGTAATLLKALSEGATTEEMVASLRDAYDVDEATATADVGDFLSDLRARELLSDE